MATKEEELIDDGYTARLTAPMDAWTVQKPEASQGQADPAEGEGDVSEDEAKAILVQMMVDAAAKGDQETIDRVKRVLEDPALYDEFLASLSGPGEPAARTDPGAGGASVEDDGGE